MDLSERRGAPIARHPWETSRLEAVEKIVRNLGLGGGARVLDVGCGDGYLVTTLAERIGFGEIVGQDIHLTDELAKALSRPSFSFVRELEGLDYRADLILLLDVLEHIPDASGALSALWRTRLAAGGRILITVPAFQILFTEHDAALKHCRRYSRRELEAEVARAGLEVSGSGYLFASLLLPRAVQAAYERLAQQRAGRAASHGIGEWRAPELITRAIHAALSLDNSLCLAASDVGVTLPGLSVWLTCRAPS
jgi:trans-aconitate methyltransferase